MFDNPAETNHWDAVIVGAGFAGLYATYRLRSLGLTVRVVERADNVGGTWHWNSYPGLRCDAESLDYSYSFSADLQQDWTWTERFASQPEILRYLEHAADRFELRQHISFETTVTAAQYLEGSGRWLVTTDDPDQRSLACTYLVLATGPLSEPQDPPFPGLDHFEGRWVQTSRWPKGGVDLVGKRVGVVGTGSTGIQVVTAIAPEVKHLTVFQRTANFSVPARNRVLDPGLSAHHKANYDQYRRAARYAGGGSTPARDFDEPGFGRFPGPLGVSALALSPEEGRAELERRWAYGGAGVVTGTFTDTMLSAEANEITAAYVRERIRLVVEDRETADLLTPTTHPLGTKRICVDSGYFETFNRTNVTLVDVGSRPIVEITRTGVRLVGDEEYDVDLLIFALGFDALTGALARIDIRGRNGASLSDEWVAGPRTYLGLMVAGFPNMFTIAGPNSPSVLGNVVTSIEQHVDLVADLVQEATTRDAGTVEATPTAQEEWVAHCHRLAADTLYPQAASWYTGANVPGKPRQFLAYVGGVGEYRRHCETIAKDGYPGFAFERTLARVRTASLEDVPDGASAGD